METVTLTATVDQPAGSRLAPWLVTTVLCAFAPCVAVYTLAIAAYVHLGHWPYYAHPDPKQLPTPFDIPYIAVWISWLFWIPATVLIGIPTFRGIYEPNLSVWKTINGLPLLLALSGSAVEMFLFPVFGLMSLIPIVVLAQIVGAFIWTRNRTVNVAVSSIPAILPVVLMAMCAAVMFVDPHGVFDWFMD